MARLGLDLASLNFGSFIVNITIKARKTITKLTIPKLTLKSRSYVVLKSTVIARNSPNREPNICKVTAFPLLFYFTQSGTVGLPVIK